MEHSEKQLFKELIGQIEAANFECSESTLFEHTAWQELRKLVGLPPFREGREIGHLSTGQEDFSQ